jgi:hypothetical protein
LIFFASCDIQIDKDINFRMNTTYVASSIITPQIIATSQAIWQP